jgi:hypothetical protein
LLYFIFLFSLCSFSFLGGLTLTCRSKLAAPTVTWAAMRFSFRRIRLSLSSTAPVPHCLLALSFFLSSASSTSTTSSSSFLYQAVSFLHLTLRRPVRPRWHQPPCLSQPRQEPTGPNETFDQSIHRFFFFFFSFHFFFFRFSSGR